MANKESYLGEFENIVLLAVLRLGKNAYGMTIRREIEERIHRDVSIGALYATLERLEKKGYIHSKTGEPTPQRGGRAKRYFRVSASGSRAIEATKKNLESMWQGTQLKPAEFALRALL